MALIKSPYLRLRWLPILQMQSGIDITIAIPVNILEIDAINALAARIKLNLVVESLETIAFLSDHLRASVDVFIKVDLGYNRTGVLVEKVEALENLIL